MVIYTIIYYSKLHYGKQTIKYASNILRYLIKNLVKVIISITYDYDLKIVFVTLVINEDIGT